MKTKFILPILAIFLVMTFVSAATLTRTAPSTVSPGSTFSVTYATSGVSGKWFVAWDDTITGCTPNSYQAFLSSPAAGSSTNDQKVASFTAPSSGSCTFSGYYQYADGAKTDFPTITVTTGTVCTPVSCAANTCIGSTCTNNCGTVEQGTKSCTTPPTPTCSDGIQNQGETGIDCGGPCTACTTPPPTTPPSYCSFTEKFNWIEIVDDDCTNGLYNLIGLIILILLGVALLK